jgi:hypothetical protein
MRILVYRIPGYSVDRLQQSKFAGYVSSVDQNLAWQPYGIEH